MMECYSCLSTASLERERDVSFPPTTYANLTPKKDTQTKDCGELEDLTPSEYHKETGNCLA